MTLQRLQRLFGGGAGPANEDDEVEERDGPGYDDGPAYDHEQGHSSPPMAGYLSAYLYRAEPRSFEDAGPIADCLKEGHPVVVNMEMAEPAEGQRIRDFLRGAAYALGGDVRKVAKRVYACVPAGVQIQPLQGGDDLDLGDIEARMSGADVGERDVWPE